MGEIRTYRDLEVWSMAMDLAHSVYRVTKTFPREEIYGLTSQLRRAAVSIPSNIAEGHARHTRKEYCRHVSIARGSLAELETQLILAKRLEYLDESTMGELWSLIQTTGRLVNGLLRSLQG